MKKYQLADTSELNLKRIVNREGDWTHYWFVKEKKALRAVNFILHQGYAAPRLLEWAKNKSAEEIDKVLSRAGDRGDAVHQAIRILLEMGKFTRSDRVLAEDNKTLRVLTDDEFDCIIAFGRFWNDHEMELIAFERTVASMQYGFAGTLDLIAKIHKSCGGRYCKCTPFVGKVGLWDHKSGSGIYPNYGAQLAAYEKAQMEFSHHTIEYTAIDQLGTNHEMGYKLEFYDREETDKHWKEFLAAKEIHDGVYRPFNFEEENEEYPDVVELVKVKEKPATGERTKKTIATAEKPAMVGDGKKKPARKIKVVRRKTNK